jgi:hypothetical protein
MWGRYEIGRKAFDVAVKRKRLLDTGTIKYRTDDRLYRKDRVAIDCFHAMAGLNELSHNGGLFGTGFKMWGQSRMTCTSDSADQWLIVKRPRFQAAISRRIEFASSVRQNRSG